MFLLDSFVLKDYASWKIENHELLDTLNKNDNLIYERLEPIYLVLEHIYDLACDQSEIDEDYEAIFQIGFNYLFSQFNVIKIYYESLFNSNCNDFVRYSEMMVFLLYIFDIRTDLENQGIESSLEALNDVETYIENMIMERREDYDYVRKTLNDVLRTIFDGFDYEFVSIIDIFVEIAENLGIFIYENKEFVIGKEI